jgi:hypothetical protein
MQTSVLYAWTHYDEFLITNFVAHVDYDSSLFSYLIPPHFGKFYGAFFRQKVSPAFIESDTNIQVQLLPKLKLGAASITEASRAGWLLHT